MKISLFDIVFKPIRTSRKLMRLMKQIELEPKFKPVKNEIYADKTEFVVLQSTTMMPAGVFNMIRPSLVAVEIDNYSPMTFARKKTQVLNTYDVSYANAVCMLVQERMEEDG